MSSARRWAFSIIAGLALLWAGFVLLTRPSNDRDWAPNERVLPYAEFSGDQVLIHNVRNTVYRTADDFTPVYEDRTYDLRRLRAVWFGVVPFSTWRGVAHTFLSFEFSGGPSAAFVVISVEARKERGETYHFLKGLFRQYELFYVVADEHDAIRLRTDYRGDAVYLYPIKTTPERARALFTAMLGRANDLREHPVFYNTLTRNCTNTIAQHVNSLVPGRVPFSFKVIFPGYSDRLAYDLGLIATDLPYDSIRAHFLVTPTSSAPPSRWR
jgi:hypothetical protein